MRPGRTREAPAILPASGPVTDGIGTLGLTLIRSSRTTVSSSTRSAGAFTPHGSRLELRTLDTDTVGTATADTATVVSAILDTSGRDTIRATPPTVALLGPLRMRTTLVVGAWAALAAPALSAAAVSVDGAGGGGFHGGGGGFHGGGGGRPWRWIPAGDGR